MLQFVWDLIARIFAVEGEAMTARQQRIFNAIVEAYHFAQDERAMRTDMEFRDLWESWKKKAEDDELKTIGEIAALFFIAMYEFGG